MPKLLYSTVRITAFPDMTDDALKAYFILLKLLPFEHAEKAEYLGCLQELTLRKIDSTNILVRDLPITLKNPTELQSRLFEFKKRYFAAFHGDKLLEIEKDKQQKLDLAAEKLRLADEAKRLKAEERAKVKAEKVRIADEKRKARAEERAKVKAEKVRIADEKRKLKAKASEDKQPSLDFSSETSTTTASSKSSKQSSL